MYNFLLSINRSIFRFYHERFHLPGFKKFLSAYRAVCECFFTQANDKKQIQLKNNSKV